MLNDAGEIEEFYDNSKMIDVWFEWDGCKGLIVHYNCHAQQFSFDSRYLVKIIRTLDDSTTDGLFLAKLGVNDHKEVCSIYQNISLLSESKSVKKLLPQIQDMFKSINIEFCGDSSFVYFDFKGGKVLKMEFGDFEFLFEMHIGLWLGIYPERDMYVYLKEWKAELIRRKLKKGEV